MPVIRLVTIKQRGQRLLADKTRDEDQLQFDLDQITLKSIVIMHLNELPS